MTTSARWLRLALLFGALHGDASGALREASALRGEIHAHLSEERERFKLPRAFAAVSSGRK